jgi:hypothetical protein
LRLVRSRQRAQERRERASIVANISRPRFVKVRMLCRRSLFDACLVTRPLAAKLFSMRLR